MIGFAGLSHLGIVSSIAAASKGCAVVGYDPDRERATALASGQLPVLEPGLPELLHEAQGRLRFTADPADLADCDVIYLSNDVPTDAANQSDPSVVQLLARSVARVAQPGATLVVLSQVPPGFTRALSVALGREHAEKRLHVIGQVETLIFGRAVERALHPERYIVGCPDPAHPLPSALARFLGAWPCPILPMRYESAELAKIAINMFLASSVSTTNTLAEVCETVGADWNEIAPALRLDRRIGPHAYLAPGLGLSGGNIERDLVTVQTLARTHGSDGGVVDAWLANSAYRRDWALRTLYTRVFSHRDRPTVAVWGLAYKPDTHSTKNSPALALLDALKGCVVRAFDPQVVLEPDRYPHVRQTGDPLEACRGADALVIMTPWRVFSTIEPAQIAAALRGRTVIDPYAALGAPDPGMSYFRLGAPGLDQDLSA